MTVPPVVGLVKLIAAEEELLQTTWLATGLIVAVGLTVMANVVAVPVQVIPELE